MKLRGGMLLEDMGELRQEMRKGYVQISLYTCIKFSKAKKKIKSKGQL